MTKETTTLNKATRRLCREQCSRQENLQVKHGLAVDDRRHLKIKRELE